MWDLRKLTCGNESSSWSGAKPKGRWLGCRAAIEIPRCRNEMCYNMMSINYLTANCTSDSSNNNGQRIGSKCRWYQHDNAIRSWDTSLNWSSPMIYFFGNSCILSTVNWILRHALIIILSRAYSRSCHLGKLNLGCPLKPLLCHYWKVDGEVSHLQ